MLAVVDVVLEFELEVVDDTVLSLVVEEVLVVPVVVGFTVVELVALLLSVVVDSVDDVLVEETDVVVLLP